jgi:hypothetical protein
MTSEQEQIKVIRVADIQELSKAMAELEIINMKTEILSTGFQSGVVVGMFLTLGIVATIFLIQGFFP